MSGSSREELELVTLATVDELELDDVTPAAVLDELEVTPAAVELDELDELFPAAVLDELDELRLELDELEELSGSVPFGANFFLLAGTHTTSSA